MRKGSTTEPSEKKKKKVLILIFLILGVAVVLGAGWLLAGKHLCASYQTQKAKALEVRKELERSSSLPGKTSSEPMDDKDIERRKAEESKRNDQSESRRTSSKDYRGNQSSSQNPQSEETSASSEATAGESEAAESHSCESSTGTASCSHDFQPVYRTEYTYERVHHDAVTEERYVVDCVAYDEEIWEMHYLCHCGFDFTVAGYTSDQIVEHSRNHALAGESTQR